MSTATPATLSTMTKREVCAFLGKSPRSVAEYMAKGRLTVRYVNGANGKQATFERADVERLKREMDTPELRAVAAPDTAQKNSASLAVVRAYPTDAVAERIFALSPADLLSMYEAMRRRETRTERPKSWLGLEDAVEASGLPRMYLLAKAREGVSWAVDVSNGGSRQRWRFNRKGLAAMGAGN